MSKVILVLFQFVFVFCLQLKAQVASCVHGIGVSYLLDAYLASIGACNCEREGVILTSIQKCNNGAFELVFEDNFDGDSLNRTLWQLQPWGQGALKTAQNMEIATLENVEVYNGQCHIVAKKETVLKRAVNWRNDDEILDDGEKNLRTFQYTSSNLWTLKKFQYGKFEIRCRMPNGSGFWPAFWMFGGQRWNEIDVFDSYAGTEKFITSVGHDFTGNGRANGCAESNKKHDLSNWHTYTLIYEYDKITVLIDEDPVREIYRVVTSARKPVLCDDNIDSGIYFQLKAFPMEAMHVIINMGIVSDAGGPSGSLKVNESTVFPSSFDIDYVKVWERQNTSITIHPNPTKGKVTVSCSSEISAIELSSAAGQKISSNRVDLKNSSVNLSGLPSGIYFLLIELDGFYKRSKIVKLDD